MDPVHVEPSKAQAVVVVNRRQASSWFEASLFKLFMAYKAYLAI
jgi:hypothetical protein